MQRKQSIVRGTESLLLLAIIMAVLGCGHKEWPRARAAQDVFIWSETGISRTADCATVSGTLGGGYANLDSVSLQIEEMGAEPCLICPFSPSRVVNFGLSDPVVTVQGPKVTVLVCGLDPNRSYRLRLIGRNIYLPLGTAESEVLFLPANERS
jgi:hypothetical protein